MSPNWQTWESSIQRGMAPSSTAPTFRSISCLLGESLPIALLKPLGKDAPKKHWPRGTVGVMLVAMGLERGRWNLCTAIDQKKKKRHLCMSWKISQGPESLLENEQHQEQTQLAFICFSFYILLTTFIFFTLKRALRMIKSKIKLYLHMLWNSIYKEQTIK